jgi:hypothetical protein
VNPKNWLLLPEKGAYKVLELSKGHKVLLLLSLEVHLQIHIKIV